MPPASKKNLSGLFLALSIVPGMLGLSSCRPSTRWDVSAGRDAADQIRVRMGELDNSQMEAYVGSVGRRLVNELEGSPFPYRFTLLDEPSPNAFAAPGGQVFVTRGLLAWLNDEHELAGVLGHEVMHIERRHTARLIQQAFVPGVLALPGAVVGDVVNHDLGNVMAGPFQDAGKVLLAGYSRESEREADRLGMDLAESAGYDPHGIVRFLNGMSLYEQWDGQTDQAPSMLDSHPMTEQRVAATAAHLARLAPTPQPSSSDQRDAFLVRLDGLIVGDNPAEGVIMGSWFVHPDAGLSIRLPRDWLYLRNRTMIAAMPLTQDAVLLYDPPTPGTDPNQEAQRLRAQLDRNGTPIVLDESVEINGIPAHRLRAELGIIPQGPYFLDVTWYALNGYVQRQVVVATAEHLQPAEQTAMSFAPITPAQRDWVTVMRLRIVTLKQGESVRQVVWRSNSPWHPAKVAALNGLDVDEPQPADRPIKIVRVEHYKARGQEPMFPIVRLQRPGPDPGGNP